MQRQRSSERLCRLFPNTNDDLGRRKKVIDPRIGETETAYNEAGQVETVTDSHEQTTEYTYYGPTSAHPGRIFSVENPAAKMTYFAYTARGELYRTWGHVPQPVQYAYNSTGERISMLTFRTAPEQFTWTDDEWPTSPSPAGDETQWHYDPATGLLLSKEYADATETTYTYTAEGKLETRTWVREVDSSPLVTEYGYDADTGDLLTIAYSDDTPDVTYVYTQSGLLKEVTDAAGTRAFTYDAGWSLTSEDLPDAFFGEDRDIWRTYESSPVAGRAESLIQATCSNSNGAIHAVMNYCNTYCGSRVALLGRSGDAQRLTPPIPSDLSGVEGYTLEGIAPGWNNDRLSFYNSDECD